MWNQWKPLGANSILNEFDFLFHYQSSWLQDWNKLSAFGFRWTTLITSGFDSSCRLQSQNISMNLELLFTDCLPNASDFYLDKLWIKFWLPLAVIPHDSMWQYIPVLFWWIKPCWYFLNHQGDSNICMHVFMAISVLYLKPNKSLLLPFTFSYLCCDQWQ